ncbi:MAG: DUF1887 family protein [Phormidium sp. BM_Day4_Bin.17]|nr:DUF1887 family protein [Phormidium sp. BM_Day4_Bin.17]UCJ13141.1 MAG: DUF1887 family protein [Phormidium sp. PBR-2020]
MKDRYLPYGAITLLSFSLCLLGFLITPDASHLGALMGLLAGGSLGTLLLQVTQVDDKYRLGQRKGHNRQNSDELTTSFNLLLDKVRELEYQYDHKIDELKQQIDNIQNKEDKSKRDIKKLSQRLDICCEKLNQLGGEVNPKDSETPAQQSFRVPSSDKIVQWLKCHQVELVSSYVGQDADTVLDQTAFFMGTNYPILRDMLHKIRQSLSHNYFGFQVNLTGEPEQKISAVTNLGTKLKNMGFLRYTYRRYGGQRVAHIRTLDSNGTQFLTGEWLERYIYQIVTKIFEDKDLEYEALMNARIKQKDGDQAEIDLLFFVKEKPLWIECKVANCEEYISRYSRFAKSFNLTLQQMFLVVLDLSPDQSQTLTNIHHLQVLTPEEVPDAIEDSLQVFDGGEPLPRAALSSQVYPTEPDVNDSDSFGLTTQEQLQSFFNNTGLRPLPDCRSQLINRLIERVSSQSNPQTASQIKTGLYSDFSGEVSNSKISEFLKMCLKGGCLLGENHQPISGFRTQIFCLSSQNWQEVENKCVEALAYRVLTQDVNYFNSADRCGHFQVVVGAAPPDPSRLTALQEEINGSA